jgi:N-methylhydantoinase A/oxoprolinase/acetone carboxylase beta subunit
MRIGIDVGGTNTDAVLMDGDRVVVGIKSSTTEDVTSGIVGALAELDRQHPFDPAAIEAVMIGTTHFINALVEARRLAPTAAVRLALPATASLPPFVDWPEALVDAVRGTGYLAHGGHEFDGRVISPLDHDELKRHAADIARRGLRSVAISSVFAPVNSELEVEAAAVLAAELGPDVAISLSHEIGRIGLLERENATIVNASLRELADQIVGGLEKAVRGHGITSPLYLSQNDGTLMGADFARRYPVATFASGPTNSMRGAALLSGLETCAVVDIGGTTSDVGVLAGGFPREATTEISVAGIRTNFRMPDVLSIGPDSVGYALGRRALVFGGDTLTTTDVAVAAGMAEVGDPALVAHLSPQLVRRTLDTIAGRVADVVERMRTSSAPLPVVAVGGGSILLPDELEGLGRIVRPADFAVANAVGAAIAQVSGELDRVYSVNDGSRQQALDDARQEAVERAVAAGASPSSVEIVDFDELVIPYLPGNAIRIRAKAVGDLEIRKAAHV